MRFYKPQVKKTFSHFFRPIPGKRERHPFRKESQSPRGEDEVRSDSPMSITIEGQKCHTRRDRERRKKGDYSGRLIFRGATVDNSLSHRPTKLELARNPVFGGEEILEILLRRRREIVVYRFLGLG